MTTQPSTLRSRTSLGNLWAGGEGGPDQYRSPAASPRLAGSHMIIPPADISPASEDLETMAHLPLMSRLPLRTLTPITPRLATGFPFSPSVQSSNLQLVTNRGESNGPWLPMAVLNQHDQPDFAASLLHDDTTLYSPHQESWGTNIRLIHHSDLTPAKNPGFHLEEILLRVPFHSPLRKGFIMICADVLPESAFDSYEHVDTAALQKTDPVACLPPVPHSVETVLYFELNENSSCFSYRFAHSLLASSIFIKMLPITTCREGRDIQFVGIKGRTGILTFPHGSLR